MASTEAVIRPVALIITHTPIWVWGVFMLLAWLGNRQWRASTLSLQLRQALKEADTRVKRKPFLHKPRLTAPHRSPTMHLTSLIAVHMTAALAATAIGPVAIWARRARLQRPTLHRRIGYTWVLLMLVTAFTALFIRDFRLPNVAGFTWIHLFVPVTLGALFIAFRRLRQGDIQGHRRSMQGLYVGGCLTAGAFTLLPGRFLGNLVFHQWLALT